MKKQSFISGAFLLAAATALGKILSAIFKIPLDRFFLHAEGMAIFNTAYNIYTFFFAIATAGVPMAISAMIAMAKDENEEKEVISTAFIFLQGVMSIVFLFLFIFAEPVSAFLGLPDAALSIKVMSVALLFIAFTAVLRGFFQGRLYMTPSALSQISDAFGRLALGFSGAFLASGFALEVCAGNALYGVPFGAALSAAVLLCFFMKSRRLFSPAFSGKALKRLLLLSIPITLTVSLHAIFNMIDTMEVVSSLTAFGFSTPKADFGCLSRAATLYALPCAIAGAISQSVLPSVSDSCKADNQLALSTNSSLAIRLSLAISLPCAAGFMAISEKILTLLYDSSLNYATLVLIAPSAVLLSVGSTQCAILQGMGKTKYSLIAAIVAIVSKIVLNPLLIFFMGVNGAALSSSLSYFILCVLLSVFTHTKTPIRYKTASVAVKPLITGALCFVTAFLLKDIFPVYVTIAIAAIVYIPMVFITGFISKDEFFQIFSR